MAVTTWPHQPWFKAGSLTGDLRAHPLRSPTSGPTEKPGKQVPEVTVPGLVLPQWSWVVFTWEVLPKLG